MLERRVVGHIPFSEAADTPNGVDLAITGDMTRLREAMWLAPGIGHTLGMMAALHATAKGAPLGSW